MFKNATTFNEPGSVIYKDARTLKRLVTLKKNELEAGRGVPAATAGKHSERIRNKKQLARSFSAEVANLAYEDEEEEDDDEEEEEEDEDEEEEEAEEGDEEMEEDEEAAGEFGLSLEFWTCFVEFEVME